MKERVVRVRGFKPLTPAQERQVAELAASDAPIDYTDIPPLDEEFWRRAVRNPFYRPVKSQLTVRLDSDILAWLKAKGSGYQTKINLIFRQAMLDDVSSK